MAEKLRFDWRNAAYRLHGAIIVAASVVFTSVALGATACQVGGSILPTNVHKTMCDLSKMDTNGITLDR